MPSGNFNFKSKTNYYCCGAYHWSFPVDTPHGCFINGEKRDVKHRDSTKRIEFREESGIFQVQNRQENKD